MPVAMMNLACWEGHGTQRLPANCTVHLTPFKNCASCPFMQKCARKDNVSGDCLGIRFKPAPSFQPAPNPGRPVLPHKRLFKSHEHHAAKSNDKTHHDWSHDQKAKPIGRGRKALPDGPLNMTNMMTREEKAFPRRHI